ncbi:789_t:CDS:1 [Scutellospora calospora]|uniref:789_t:CDS:1 n=1 Tax=Scutellospora calospora TaxID=85575 RepID=A0ACA9JWW4_9GLOM|nr:789_t:CDS:1 [Scutellospora calospora]
MSQNKMLDSRSIEYKFEEYDEYSKYLFFINNDEIMSLDDFRYEDEYNNKVPQIKASFPNGKQAFLINETYTYNIYYKEKLFMKIEPDEYSFGHSGMNDNRGKCDFIILLFKGEEMKEIPNDFRCEFNGKPVKKVKYYDKECFDISNVGEYNIYRNDKLYDRITTSLVWTYSFDIDVKDVNSTITRY